MLVIQKMSNNIIINSENFSKEIGEILNSYDEKIIDGLKKSVKDAADELTKSTKKDAPVRTGEFKRKITNKKIYEDSRSVTYLWGVNDPKWRITHLIENDHKSINGNIVKGKKRQRQT